jgi:uncharacterized protein (DUF58 family)
VRRGPSVEFADYREYAPGDDLRHLDWSVYARLDRLVVRLCVEEEDVRIDVLVDASESMRFGEPETKLDYARRVAAAIGYLGIAGLDRVGVATFAERLGPRLRAARGRGQLLALLRFLDAIRCDESVPTNLAAALERYGRETVRPGVVFVVSDFLDASDYVTSLKRLAHRRFDVNLIQVLTPEEVDPPLGGDLVLVDNTAMATAYRRSLSALAERLTALGPSSNIVFHATTTAVPFDDLILRHLRARRLVTTG